MGEVRVDTVSPFRLTAGCRPPSPNRKGRERPFCSQPYALRHGGDSAEYRVRALAMPIAIGDDARSELNSAVHLWERYRSAIAPHERVMAALLEAGASPPTLRDREEENAARKGGAKGTPSRSAAAANADSNLLFELQGDLSNACRLSDRRVAHAILFAPSTGGPNLSEGSFGSTARGGVLECRGAQGKQRSTHAGQVGMKSSLNGFSKPLYLGLSTAKARRHCTGLRQRHPGYACFSRRAARTRGCPRRAPRALDLAVARYERCKTQRKLLPVGLIEGEGIRHRRRARMQRCLSGVDEVAVCSPHGLGTPTTCGALGPLFGDQRSNAPSQRGGWPAMAVWLCMLVLSLWADAGCAARPAAFAMAVRGTVFRSRADHKRAKTTLSPLARLATSRLRTALLARVDEHCRRRVLDDQTSAFDPRNRCRVRGHGTVRPRGSCLTRPLPPTLQRLLQLEPTKVVTMMKCHDDARPPSDALCALRRFARLQWANCAALLRKGAMRRLPGSSTGWG